MTDSDSQLPLGNYSTVLVILKERIRSAQSRGAVAVNQRLILL